MARKFWFVFCENIIPTYEGDDPGAMLMDTTVRQPKYGIFFRKDRADQYAKKLSGMHPGVEVQVAEAMYGFHSPAPVKITQKVWNAEGEYVLP